MVVRADVAVDSDVLVEVADTGPVDAGPVSVCDSFSDAAGWHVPAPCPQHHSFLLADHVLCHFAYPSKQLYVTVLFGIPCCFIACFTACVKIVTVPLLQVPAPCLQHHDFLSTVQTSFHLEYPAWQSYRPWVVKIMVGAVISVVTIVLWMGICDVVKC